MGRGSYVDHTGELFEQFFRAHYTQVLSFMERRVLEQADASELCADVFRVAWQKFDSSNAQPRAWLFAIARNVLLDHYKRSGRRAAVVQRHREEAQVQASQHPTIEPGPHPLLAYLGQLPIKDREILQLRYWEDLDLNEIAEVLNISEANTRVRLHRARTKLEALLPPSMTTKGAIR